jgi:outer membrane lipoprotein SlyB
MRLVLLTFTLFYGVFATTAQAAEPQFYPNQKYKNSTISQVNNDVTLCKSHASANVGNNSGSTVRKGLGTAAKGAALGALAGAIGGNAGRGAGAGAAVGGTVGVVRGAREKGDGNPEFQKFVNFCLEEKGYKVLGWR